MSQESTKVNLEGLSEENQLRIAQGLGIIGVSLVQKEPPANIPAPLLSVDSSGRLFLPPRVSSGDSLTL